MEAQLIDTPRGQCARMCFAAKSGSKEIQILPPAGMVAARDGRSFMLSDPKKVLSATTLPLLVDWDHASEYGQTRAAGWVTSFDVRPSGTFGRVEYTPEGQADVDSKRYLYLSPSLLISTDTREAQQLLAVALTNRPALTMEAISAFSESLSHRPPFMPPPVPTPPGLYSTCFREYAPAGMAVETYDALRHDGLGHEFIELALRSTLPAGMEIGSYAACRQSGMSHEDIVGARAAIAKEQAQWRGDFDDGRA